MIQLLTVNYLKYYSSNIHLIFSTSILQSKQLNIIIVILNGSLSKYALHYSQYNYLGWCMVIG